MRSLQNAIAALLVLLATGSAVALAGEPAGAPATEPAAAIEITYSYSNDPSTAKPLDGALVDDAFYVFFDPNLPEGTYEANFFVDSYRNHVGRIIIAPFSIRYDPSGLSHGLHHFFVLYNVTGSSESISVDANFSYGEELGEVQFAVLADSHLCNPYYLVGDNCKTYLDKHLKCDLPLVWWTWR